MTTFTTAGSTASFATSGTTTTFTLAPTTNQFATTPYVTPSAHASSHGAGGSDPITTLGTVTTTLGSAVTLNVGTATIAVGTVTTLSATNTATFGSAVSIALGGAASPTLRFTGDTNTGIYSPGADQLAIATAGTARAVVDTTGNVVFGNTGTIQTYLNSSALTPGLQRIGTGDDAAILSARFSNGIGGAAIYFAHSRGTTVGSQAVMNSGDIMGRFSGAASDGSQFHEGARVEFATDGATSAGNVPGRIALYTTPSGGVSITERMRIDNAGLITGTGTSLGAWTAWTPSWTSSGTAPAIGNSTITAAYCRIGKIVLVRMAISFGSSATYGTGAYYFTIPVTAISTAGSLNGGGIAFDSSASSTYRLFPVYDSTTRLAVHTNASPIGFVGQTAPFTWAQDDVIQLNYWYEAA